MRSGMGCSSGVALFKKGEQELASRSTPQQRHVRISKRMIAQTGFEASSD